MLTAFLAFFMIPWVFVTACAFLIVAGSYHVSRDYSFWATVEFAILLALVYAFFQPELSVSDIIPLVLAYVGVGTLWAVWRWIIHVRKYKTIVHDALKASYASSGALNPLSDDLNVVGSLGDEYSQRSKYHRIMHNFYENVNDHDLVERGSVYLKFLRQVQQHTRHDGLDGPDDDTDLLQDQRKYFQTVLPRISSIRGFVCEWIWLWPLSMLGHVISDTVTIVIDSLTGLFSRISSKIMGLPTV